MIEHSYLVGPVSVTSLQDTHFFTVPTPPYHRDYYICTGCHAYSCGVVYASICTVCDSISSDPPRNIRRHYFCTECARHRPTCICDRQPRHAQPPPSPPRTYLFRDPPEYCWCSCCTCCTYTCSCTCCRFFCECLSARCHPYEPCCYCTRICCPKEECCKRW